MREKSGLDEREKKERMALDGCTCSSNCQSDEIYVTPKRVMTTTTTNINDEKPDLTNNIKNASTAESKKEKMATTHQSFFERFTCRGGI